MASTIKVDVLKERFEILKDKYLGNDSFHTRYTIVEKIIAPMLELDYNEGVAMWEYMLKQYVNCEHPVDYTVLTDHLVSIVDFDILRKIFSTNEIIREYVFRLDPYENHLSCEHFIGFLVMEENFELAELLIKLFLQNDNGENNVQKNLHELLYCGIVANSESKWRMTSAGIDFVSKWIPLVEDEARRSELEVCLINLIDCVENGAPKGAMPFSLFASEGGLEMFIEERSKQTKRKEGSPKSTFDAYMDERRERRTVVEEFSEIEKDSDKLFDVDALMHCQKELDELIGLSGVKTEVAKLTNLVQVRRLRQERGIANPETSQHLVFVGNPGTGKTTVARMIGKIYHALGYLSKGHCVEVSRSELVAGYVGQTAIKTQDVIDRAKGGVLFIDEAYSLCVEKSENDFGRESIDTLLKEMEDNRDEFVVIVAGYEELMRKFINSNPGLRSRFNKYVYFPDYTGEELFEIFMLLMNKNQYTAQEDLIPMLKDFFKKTYVNRGENFANGREVRNFFEKLIEVQAGRIVTIPSPSNEDIVTITVQDFLTAGDTICINNG